ncbi:aminodeoxychorismate lyase [Litchfieldella xinjiangensis]|uniref:aminodeoxychorismate lyase n=1 Tax=Litchfieldella xinjiangensis TaxID=1166948 RepID=UPI0005BBDE3A|nr:aminodeoxychorismate lyase [Halomonas xinjiangensis]
MAHDTAVPFDDRGLAYGDGVFETVLVRDGVPLLWEHHLARLTRGCHRLGITLPTPEALNAPFAHAERGLAVLKLIVTRGSGGRGYALPEAPECRLRWRIVPFTPNTSAWHGGVRIRHCALRLSRQPALAGLKHLNRLENVLARAEWTDDRVEEGLLCDEKGWIVEATSMNLFWQREGRLETPSLTACGVAGTLRAALRKELAIDEVERGPEALSLSEALWVGNSVQGLWPVTRLDDTQGNVVATWSLSPSHRRFQNVGQRLLGYPALPLI